tara:strand:+ start:272 stop:1237 length:966 start_codon:yes stop_codon:yes gene_type:complete
MLANPRLILVITGPTGIGKTNLSMRLSEQFPIRLLSADSVMVYQHLNIGSAKPTAAQLLRNPHELIDLVPPEHPFDVGQFVAYATEAIKRAWDSNLVPCLVGGTIMYLKSLLDGLDPLPSSDPIIRNKIREKAEQTGWPSVHAWLESLDSDAAQMIHPNHSSRIERALEVRLITGDSIRSFWSGRSADHRIAGIPFEIAILTLWPSNREQLKNRLDRRFDEMLTDGLETEVRSLKQRPELSLSCTSMRSVGYRQMWQFLDGDISELEMRQKAKAATRQLAKRQMTWLRSWRADTNTMIEVAGSLPVTEAEIWLSRELDHVF